MLVSKTHLRVTGKYKVAIFIWPTQKQMQARIRKLSGKDESKTGAYFHAPRTKIYPSGRVEPETVGEIHLVKGRFGAGVFAHELQHFISWWCNIRSLDPMEKHWEYVPKIAGNMTNQFWKWFYEEEAVNVS